MARETYSGMYCKKCRGTERFVSDKRCVACKVEADRIQYEKRRAKQAENTGQNIVLLPPATEGNQQA